MISVPRRCLAAAPGSAGSPSAHPGQPKTCPHTEPSPAEPELLLSFSSCSCRAQEPAAGSGGNSGLTGAPGAWDCAH